MSSSEDVLRLDKYLCDMGVGSRREIKEFCKKGRICVNDKVVKSSDIKISVGKEIVLFDGVEIIFEKYEYYMLNKPAGVVSATVDNTCKTVIDLIESNRKKDLFPVGRLDKDTVGLLLITNDGELSHKLLSPSKHIPKKYFVRVSGELRPEHIKICQQGIKLEENFVTKPSELKILSSGKISEAELTICEGKFHQVKRMMQAFGCNVIYLKRISMGHLILDENLQEGQYRRLTESEIEVLKR
jgi:16S rRNA pseudouridine516 synthase